MRTNTAYNFTVHMKNGDIHHYPAMTLRQFGKESSDINVIDVENIEKEVAAIPSQTHRSDLLNFLVGRKI